MAFAHPLAGAPYAAIRPLGEEDLILHHLGHQSVDCVAAPSRPDAAEHGTDPGRVVWLASPFAGASAGAALTD